MSDFYSDPGVTQERRVRPRQTSEGTTTTRALIQRLDEARERRLREIREVDARGAFKEIYRSPFSRDRDREREFLKLFDGAAVEADLYEPSIYNTKKPHPSGKAACGIVFSFGDCRSPDCWVNYEPGTLMGPPLRRGVSTTGIFTTKWERPPASGGSLQELLYLSVMSIFVRFNQDISRQLYVAISQEPMQDMLPESYIVKLRAYRVFIDNAFAGLMAKLVTQGLYGTELSPKYGALRKKFDLNKLVDLSKENVGKFADYMGYLTVYTEDLPGVRQWPRSQTPEFEIRLRWKEFAEYNIPIWRNRQTRLMEANEIYLTMRRNRDTLHDYLLTKQLRVEILDEEDIMDLIEIFPPVLLDLLHRVKGKFREVMSASHMRAREYTRYEIQLCKECGEIADKYFASMDPSNWYGMRDIEMYATIEYVMKEVKEWAQPRTAQWARGGDDLLMKFLENVLKMSSEETPPQISACAMKERKEEWDGEWADFSSDEELETVDRLSKFTAQKPQNEWDVLLTNLEDDWAHTSNYNAEVLALTKNKERAIISKKEMVFDLIG